MNVRWLALLTVLLCMGASAQVPIGNSNQIQVGRYTTVTPVPLASVSDPLAIYAQLRFPRETVRSVGEALQYTLLRTGYSLAASEHLTERARYFLTLPLPESQRQLGPYTVRELLSIVLGSAWELQVDPLTRQVWFKASPTYAQAAIAGTAATGTALVPPTALEQAPSIRSGSLQGIEPQRQTVTTAAATLPTAQADGATASTKPVASPAAVAGVSRQWLVHQQDTSLRAVLTRWAAQDGRALHWAVGDDYALAGTSIGADWVHQGTLFEAMAKLAVSYGVMKQPFRVAVVDATTIKAVPLN